MNDKKYTSFDNWIKEIDGPDGSDMYSKMARKWAKKAWLAAKEGHEPRWISTEERTPSARSPVLVYCPETVVRFTACYLEEDKEWIFSGAFCEPLIHQVTHWMPLPSEPSTQGGGE